MQIRKLVIQDGRSTKAASGPSDESRRPVGDDQGSILVALTLLTLPLVLIVSTAMMSMTSRNSRFLFEVQRERAILAAEAGLDEAVFMSNTGPGLTHGQVITRTLRDGMSFRVQVSLLWSDGLDNDGDGSVDEVDETVIQLVIDGSHRNVTRRIAAYLGPLPSLPTIETSVAVHNPGIQLKLNDHNGLVPGVSGIDTKIDGSPGTGAAVPGMSIAPPGTTADLLGELSAFERTLVTGVGATPSLGVTSGAIDFAALRTAIVNAANVVLSEDEYTNLKLGNAATGDYNIVYRDGELELDGNSSGAGILYVRGEFEVEDSFRWDGIIIVEDDEEFEMEDNAHVNGAVILGPSVTEFELKGNSTVTYSTEVIKAIAAMLPGKFVAFNGWQEIKAN